MHLPSQLSIQVGAQQTTYIDIKVLPKRTVSEIPLILGRRARIYCLEYRAQITTCRYTQSNRLQQTRELKRTQHVLAQITHCGSLDPAYVLPACLSVYPCIYLSVHLSIYLSTYLSFSLGRQLQVQGAIHIQIPLPTPPPHPHLPQSPPGQGTPATALYPDPSWCTRGLTSEAAADYPKLGR